MLSCKKCQFVSLTYATVKKYFIVKISKPGINRDDNIITFLVRITGFDGYQFLGGLVQYSLVYVPLSLSCQLF